MSCKKKNLAAQAWLDGTKFGEEYNGEVTYDERWSYDYKEFAYETIYKLGLKSDYDVDQRVHIEIFELLIKNGKLVKSRIKAIEVMLPKKPPSAKQYEEEMTEILSALPVEFRGYVSMETYNRGHSSGMAEIINITREIVSNLEEPIEKFKKRITSKDFE